MSLQFDLESLDDLDVMLSSSNNAKGRDSDSSQTDAIEGSWQLPGVELNESAKADMLDDATIEQLMLLLTPCCVKEGAAGPGYRHSESSSK